MTQRQQSHPQGTFPTCTECAHEPRHYDDARRRPIGGQFLSCCCGDTPKFDNLSQALLHWCAARNLSMTVRPVAAVHNLKSRARS